MELNPKIPVLEPPPCYLISKSISIHLQSDPTFVDGNRQIPSVPFTLDVNYKDGTSDTASGYLSCGKWVRMPPDDLTLFASSDWPVGFPPGGVTSSAGITYPFQIYPNGAVVFQIAGESNLSVDGYHNWKARCSYEEMTWTGAISKTRDHDPGSAIPPYDDIPVRLPFELV